VKIYWCVHPSHNRQEHRQSTTATATPPPPGNIQQFLLYTEVRKIDTYPSPTNHRPVHQWKGTTTVFGLYGRIVTIIVVIMTNHYSYIVQSHTRNGWMDGVVRHGIRIFIQISPLLPVDVMITTNNPTISCTCMVWSPRSERDQYEWCIQSGSTTRQP